MTGFAEGMAQNEANKSRNGQALGMSGNEASNFQADLASSYREAENCNNAVEANFLSLHPEHSWATKSSEEFTLSDLSSTRRISGDKEKNALVGYVSAQEVCLEDLFSTLEKYGGVSADILATMEMFKTELYIIYSQYLDGSISRGELARSIVATDQKIKTAGQDLARQIQAKRNAIEERAALNELRAENRKLLREMKRNQFYQVRSTRPIFCHKYYGINTVSCY
nr:hypothetical protein 10 [Alphaproteobacteria bacterium]